MNRGRRQFEWPWKDILYFAGTLVIITLALVVAATLFVEYANLQNRTEALEEYVDTIPGLLEDIRKELCDKVDALRDDLNDLTENVEENFQPLIEKGAIDGYAPLDNEAIVPSENLPANLREAMFLGNDGGGCWDPSTNAPLLLGGQRCTIGEFYITNNTGSSILDDFGGLGDPWQIGDAIVCTADIGWKRIRDIPRVKTWNGITGDVEAFLDTLLDVDQAGASIGDALVLTTGNIWKPRDCCVAGPGGTSVGFLARLDGHDSEGPSEDDTDDIPQRRVQYCFRNLWQSVDFRTTGRFPVGTTQPVQGGAIWDPTDPNFVHMPHNFSGTTFFGSGTYTIPETGWWHVQSKIRVDPASSDDNLYAMRLFRLNTGLEAIYQQESLLRIDKTLLGYKAVLTIEGAFAFCSGEMLQMQFFQNTDDDDTGDTPCLAEYLGGDPNPFIPPFSNPRFFPPEGGMYWSMWKMPNVLMPTIDICALIRPVKKRDHNEEPIVYPTTWEDPALLYRFRMERWKRNTAFYNQQCEGPINCTHYKPGPKPEMPSILKPPPLPPTVPPDSELKK